MHAKCLVADDYLAFVGSVNLTHNGFSFNKEQLLRISAPKCVSDIFEAYEQIWQEAEPITETRMNECLKRATDDRAQKTKVEDKKKEQIVSRGRQMLGTHRLHSVRRCLSEDLL